MSSASVPRAAGASDLLLDRGDGGGHIGIRQHGALVDDGDLSGRNLGAGGLRQVVISWETSAENAQLKACVTL